MITGTAGSSLRISRHTSKPAASGSGEDELPGAGVRHLLAAELGLEEPEAVPRVLGSGAGRRRSPQIEVGTSGLGSRADRRPPGEIVAHQLRVPTAAPRKQAVRPPA